MRPPLDRPFIFQFFFPIKRASMHIDIASQIARHHGPTLPVRQEAALDPAPRSPNGFLSSLTADDFELIRPHLRTVDLVHQLTLVEVDEPLKRAYLPHKGAISLVVKLSKGEYVQI